jgi:VIT1/CCC1 family predicted Fe2+/Mn2+ transporter
MTTALSILALLAMLAVLGVLFAGIFGFVSGKGGGARANRLMQYRVLWQGVAIALFALLMYLQKG